VACGLSLKPEAGIDMDPKLTVYLVRHAIAAERGDDWPDDAKRPLTPDGMTRFKEAARGLVEMEVVVDAVLTSPLVRARQTAEILAAVLPGDPPIVEMAALAPGAAVKTVVDELGKQGRRRRLALVGHEPGIGELAGRLVGAANPIPFKKGAACRIDFNGPPSEGPGMLRWFAPPKILRRLGK
jgi:phosphohistidine phosphatase